MSHGVEVITTFINQFITAVAFDKESIKIEVQERPLNDRKIMTVFTLRGATYRDASILIGVNGYTIAALRYMVERIAIQHEVGLVNVEIRDSDQVYKKPPRFIRRRGERHS